MSESIINDKSTTSIPNKNRDIMGIIGIIAGIMAWIILSRFQICGITLAFVGLILSIIGLKGRFRNIAMGGIITSGVLLLVVGIMWAIFFYLFQSIE